MFLLKEATDFTGASLSFSSEHTKGDDGLYYGYGWVALKGKEFPFSYSIGGDLNVEGYPWNWMKDKKYILTPDQKNFLLSQAAALKPFIKKKSKAVFDGSTWLKK